MVFGQLKEMSAALKMEHGAEMKATHILYQYLDSIFPMSSSLWL